MEVLAVQVLISSFVPVGQDRGEPHAGRLSSVIAAVNRSRRKIIAEEESA